MNPPSFTPPALEDLDRLLPAFGFTSLLASDEVSAVYAAAQKSLERNVAIKLLSPQVSGDPGFRSVFESTARTMAKLNHPNLIGVFDSGYVDGMLYFVMEFIPGKSLAHSARGQRVELSQALRLLQGISAGLAHAHDHGVVHGCPHPSIILLNQKAEPKIGSFGISHRSMDPDNPCLAPELRIPGAVPDFRADIHAAGAILYELITGQPHRQGAEPPSLLTGCPPQIDAIWKRATAPEASGRHPGMREFQKEISALVADTAVKGREAASGASRNTPAGSPLRPAPGGAPPMPPAPQPPVPRQTGVNWRMIFGLLVNAGLVYAIYLAWGFYQERKEQAERSLKEHQSRIERQGAAGIEDAGSRGLSNRNGSGATDIPVVPDIPPLHVPKSETPEESLPRLKPALAAGRRDEMPPTAVEQGESCYFLVRNPMSWPEAAEFAEQHGAHLAVPAAGADLTWLVNQVTHKLDVWIGAARSAQGTWTLADGKAWKPSKEPGGAGTYVGVDKAGFLRAASVKVRLPFVIQWHRDGKNPGALESLLANTKASLTSSTPVYPPGTRSLDRRHFLYVARRADWNEAARLATAGGACLAVAATAAEIGYLDDLTADIAAPDGIWLGGLLREKQWTWITGETWKSAKWSAGAANDIPGSALIIRPGKDWDAIRSGGFASGFIIEWSDDGNVKSGVTSRTNPGAASVPAAADLDALVLKAREVIAATERKRVEQLGANSRKMASDLDSHLRGLPKSGQDVWRPEVERIKACVRDSRVPVMIPQGAGIRINTTMDGIIRCCAKKQQQIDDDFLVAAGKVHAAFLIKLRQSLAEARQAGQPVVVESLEESIRKAENLDGWIRAMGVEPRPGNPVPATRENEGDGNGAGNE